MDTEEATTAAETSTPASSRGFYGCVIALIAFFTLIALGAHAFTEFEKGLDGEPGASGQDYSPGHRETARFQLTLG
ncbi:hypothetical protein ACFCY9_00035 [Streptomyces fimicarius]|uniref:hypothetical protein n=1 Tax=Streptomyces griseus TaxID=1911 RepID=UPI0035DFB383